jgi:hypothetical protein
LVLEPVRLQVPSPPWASVVQAASLLARVQVPGLPAGAGGLLADRIVGVVADGGAGCLVVVRPKAS